MRKAFYISTFLILLTSCKSEHQKNLTKNSERSIRTEVTDFDGGFSEWLTSKGIERKIIVDTMGERAFELWAYRNDLEASDSAYYWYPSKDSSYYLITNYNQENKKRIITDYSKDIQLRFLKTETKEVFIGLLLLDSLEMRNIDFYWYNSTSFFFLEGKGSLTELKMGVDSIWTYKIEK
jgi:hypothetical protein